tara:strand:+ start:887 stop:3391 length:2505 start_codon:yes stop_codon:yes gene_type:complete
MSDTDFETQQESLAAIAKSLTTITSKLGSILDNEIKLIAARESGGDAATAAKSMEDLSATLEVVTIKAGGASGGLDATGKQIETTGGKAEDAVTALAGLSGTFDNLNKSIDGFIDKDLYKQMNKIQDQVGGLGQGIGNASGAGKELADIMYGVNDALQGGSSSIESMGVNLEGLLGPTSKASSALMELVTGNQAAVDSYAVFKTATADTALEMKLFGEKMGLSSRQTSTFVTRQISLTGQAGTDMLKNAAVYAKRVASATGDSTKMILGQMEQIIASTSMFGNVTVDEAARVASSLRQLGIDFKDLNGMVSKYANFESAASSVSALTSVFGVQLDAMKAMQMANSPDKLEYLMYMREQFLNTAKSVDDMSLAEKRLIQTQLGLSDVATVERLFDPDKEISSMEDLTAATGDSVSSSAEAITELQDELFRLGDISKNTLEQFKDNMGKAFKSTLQRGVIDTAIVMDREYDKLTRNMQERSQGLAKNSGISKSLNDISTTLAETMKGIAEGITAGIDEAFTKLGDLFDKMLKKMSGDFEESDFNEGSMSVKGKSLYEGFKPAVVGIGVDMKEMWKEASVDSDAGFTAMVKSAGTQLNKLSVAIGDTGIEWSDMIKSQQEKMAKEMFGDASEKSMARAAEVWNSNLKEVNKKTRDDTDDTLDQLRALAKSGMKSTEGRVQDVMKTLAGDDADVMKKLQTAYTDMAKDTWSSDDLIGYSDDVYGSIIADREAKAEAEKTKAEAGKRGSGPSGEVNKLSIEHQKRLEKINGKILVAITELKDTLIGREGGDEKPLNVQTEIKLDGLKIAEVVTKHAVNGGVVVNQKSIATMTPGSGGDK